MSGTSQSCGLAAGAAALVRGDPLGVQGMGIPRSEVGGLVGWMSFDDLIPGSLSRSRRAR